MDPSRLPFSSDTCSKGSSHSLEGKRSSNASPYLLLLIISKLKSHPEDSRKMIMCLCDSHTEDSTRPQIQKYFSCDFSLFGHMGAGEANLNIWELVWSLQVRFSMVWSWLAVMRHRVILLLDINNLTGQQYQICLLWAHDNREDKTRPLPLSKQGHTKSPFDPEKTKHAHLLANEWPLFCTS